MQRKVEEAVNKLPEVELMFSKTGTAEVATDPMPPNISDGFVILKPQDQWPAGVETKADVIEKIEKVAGGQLGQLYERSEEHTSELQSLMRISYAVFCLKKKKLLNSTNNHKHAYQQNNTNSQPYTNIKETSTVTMTNITQANH